MKRSGRVRDVRNLIHVVARAAEGFVATGEQIANENPEFQVSTEQGSLLATFNVRINKELALPGITPP